MADSRRLVYSINKFLKDQLKVGVVPKEFEEGIEVSIQCLESAYNIGPSEPDLEVPTSLQNMFQKYLQEIGVQNEATAEEKAAADSFKQKGNLQMDLHHFEEAVLLYTRAINLDPNNPVYYSNRAAALNNLGKHEGAIQDCKSALKLDPLYSKAHCRLGITYHNTHHLQESVDCYKRAVELDPTNESYKMNLRIAESALASSQTRPNQNTSFNFQIRDEDLSIPQMVRMVVDNVSARLTQNDDGNDIGRLINRFLNPNDGSRTNQNPDSPANNQSNV